MIALSLAKEYPGRIEKLVLCDTRHKIGNAETWNTRIDQVKSSGIKSISDAVMGRWFPESFQKTHPQIVQGCKNMLKRNSPEGYIHCCAAIRDADLTEIASQIRHSALIIVGSEDGSTTPADVRSLHELMPGSEFVIMNGSGHIPCVDNPTALSKLIADFIK
jgi:3-oxoadipate enol-lactonase